MTTITILKDRSIFTSLCQVIVNDVNCVGIAEHSLSSGLKHQYPQMFEQYKDFCSKQLLTVGKLWLYKSDNKWILNFPTKAHWREQFNYDYIESGMQKFIETYKDKNIKTIAFPLLGNPNNELDKNTIIELMVKYLIKCDDIIVEIYY